jgi:hypothetical protein
MFRRSLEPWVDIFFTTGTWLGRRQGRHFHEYGWVRAAVSTSDLQDTS